MYPGMFYLRVPSSVQQPSAALSKYVPGILQYVFFMLVKFVPYPILEFCLSFLYSSS